MVRIATEAFKRFGDDAAPQFELTINDIPMENNPGLFEKIRPVFINATFEDDIRMSSLMNFEIAVEGTTSPGSPIDWREILDFKGFQEGNVVKLWMGYGENLTFMDAGFIVEWDISGSASELPKMRIACLDGRHLMQAENRQKNPCYFGIPDYEIVERVARLYGFDFDIDQLATRMGTKTRPTPKDRDDWKFLQKLADMNYANLWVDWKEDTQSWQLNFNKKDVTGEPEFLFDYNLATGNLLDWSMQFSIKDQKNSIELLHFDQSNRKVEVTAIVEYNKGENVKLSSAGTTRYRAVNAITSGSRVRFNAHGRTIQVISSQPFKNKKDAKSFADTWLRQNQEDLLTLKGTIIGNEKVRARQVNEVNGISNRVDGLYYMENVKHVMTPGQVFKTEFVARKITDTALFDRPAVPGGKSGGIVLDKYNRARLVPLPTVISTQKIVGTREL